MPTLFEIFGIFSNNIAPQTTIIDVSEDFLEVVTDSKNYLT